MRAAVGGSGNKGQARSGLSVGKGKAGGGEARGKVRKRERNQRLGRPQGHGRLHSGRVTRSIGPPSGIRAMLFSECGLGLAGEFRVWFWLARAILFASGIQVVAAVGGAARVARRARGASGRDMKRDGCMSARLSWAREDRARRRVLCVCDATGAGATPKKKQGRVRKQRHLPRTRVRRAPTRQQSNPLRSTAHHHTDRVH